MNELKRCLQVFTHSPFKVRLMLIGMLCDLLNGKKEQDKPRN
ncbi:manganase accumulation protein MntS [Raoultella sp. Ech2A]|nr:manganase accumulation protein MntS [Raoultella sp. Ech2A]MDJ1654671.1 manganase accumulation protein MntS [Raoultella sp. Ech2A]